MNILIGSRALNYWLPHVKITTETDWDVISPEPILGCEWHNPAILNNSKLGRFASFCGTVLPDGSSAQVMGLPGLALIKRSHLHRALSFNKHIAHYHKYLKGCLNPEVPELQERIELTHKEYPQWNPNLNQSVEGFFDDAVEKKYNHDFLHELVAYEDKPLYTKMQKNPKSAWCSRELWDDFTHDQKVRCVAEEVQVIALERFLIPKDFDFNPRIGYNKALEKVCTTLCSGWFRDFAIENYPEILGLFDKERILGIQSHLK